MSSPRNDAVVEHSAAVSAPDSESTAAITLSKVVQTYGSKADRVTAVGPVDLRVDPGEFLVLVGASGCGKSTLLRLIAGFETPTSGRVTVARESPTPGVGAGVVFQQPRLFPWRTVGGNVDLALRYAGVPKAQRRTRRDELLRRVGLGDTADRRIWEISGGQQQRVAIARALAGESSLLLLDEPFAALDVDVAQQMRSLMRHLLADRAGMTVLVTHDLIDVVSLAGRIAVIDDARIVQTGPTTSVLTRPESAFTASLAGTNLIVGQLRDAGTVVADDGIRVVGTVVESAAAGRAAAAFSPRAVAVYLRDPQGSPRNSWHGVVEDVIPQGDRALVRTRCGEHRIGAEVTWASVVDLDLSPGTDVVLAVKATEVSVYGAAGSPS